MMTFQGNMNFSAYREQSAPLRGPPSQRMFFGFAIAAFKSNKMPKFSATAVILLFPLCLVLGQAVTSSFALAAEKLKEDNRAKQLDNEKTKLSRATNPEARAKTQMRIAEILLSYVGEAATAGDLGKMQTYADQYRQAVTDARDTMMKSGLDPHKKSGGYKAVEIALRKQKRALQDIARMVGVDERRSLDDAVEMVTKIRDEFIQALFG